MDAHVNLDGLERLDLRGLDGPPMDKLLSALLPDLGLEMGEPALFGPEDAEEWVHEVKAWADDAAREVRLLSVEPARGRASLHGLQVTSRSPVGALALETGGLLVDGGFVRVLGGGCDQFQWSIDEWNRVGQPSDQHRLPGALLVGDDVLGGFFALNGGGFRRTHGSGVLFPPDTWKWECLELGYSEWLIWLMQGNVDLFYEAFAWDGWRDECGRVRADQTINFAPPLVFEADDDVRSRRAVPIEEQWSFSMDRGSCSVARQAGLIANGSATPKTHPNAAAHSTLDVGERRIQALHMLPAMPAMIHKPVGGSSVDRARVPPIGPNVRLQKSCAQASATGGDRRRLTLGVNSGILRIGRREARG